MVKFLKLTGDHEKLGRCGQAKEFSAEIKAVSFKRCRTKNVNGHWQIACYDVKNKLVGFIILTNQKSRLAVYEFLTGDQND